MITQIWCGNNHPEPIQGARVLTIPESNTPTISADYARFELAIKEPDLIYADFDIEPFDGFYEYFKSLKPGKPHFVKYANYPECCLFAVNGCCDFFKELLEDKKRRNISDCYSWTFKILRMKKTQVYYIPNEIYNHRHDTYSKLKKEK